MSLSVAFPLAKLPVEIWSHIFAFVSTLSDARNAETTPLTSLIFTSKFFRDLFFAHARSIRTSPFVLEDDFERVSKRLASVTTLVIDQNRGVRKQKFLQLFSGSTAEKAKEREGLSASPIVAIVGASLRRLTLQRCNLNISPLLECCGRLEFLELVGVHFDDPLDLSSAPSFSSQLRSLKLFRSQSTFPIVGALVTNSAGTLEHLDMSWSLRFDDHPEASFAFLSEIQNLITFNASGCLGRRSYYPFLKCYPNLTALDLSFGSALDGRVVADAGLLTNLRSLRLDLCSGITVGYWLNLSSLVNLSSLKVDETSFTETHFNRLKMISQLEVLHMGRTNSWAPLEVITKTPSAYSLRVLLLPNLPNFTFPSESEMGTLMSLTTIEIGPKGLRNSLIPRLRALPSLTSVSFLTTAPSSDFFYMISDNLDHISELKIKVLGEWVGPPPEEDDPPFFPPRLSRLSLLGLFPVAAPLLASIVTLKRSLLQLSLTETRPLSRTFVESLPTFPALEDLDIVGCELPRAVAVFIVRTLPPQVALKL